MKQLFGAVPSDAVASYVATADLCQTYLACSYVMRMTGNKVLVQIPRGVVPSLMRIQRPNLPASDAPSYGQCGGLGEMLHSPKARPPSGQTMPATEYF